MLERHLGGSLRTIYLFGSAIKGGFKPCSDMDLFVATDTSLAGPVRRALVGDLLSISAKPGTSALHRALEVTVVLKEVVPWRYPPLRELQFGEWLREELEYGSIPPPVAGPDPAILLTQVRQRSLCLSGAPASATIWSNENATRSGDGLFLFYRTAFALSPVADAELQWRHGPVDVLGLPRQCKHSLRLPPFYENSRARQVRLT